MYKYFHLKAQEFFVKATRIVAKEFQINKAQDFYDKLTLAENITKNCIAKKLCDKGK